MSFDLLRAENLVLRSQLAQRDERIRILEEALRALDVVTGELDGVFMTAGRLLESALTGKPMAVAELLESGRKVGAIADHAEAARRTARAALAPKGEP